MNDVSLSFFLLFTTFLVAFYIFRKKRKENEGNPLPGPPLFEGLKIFTRAMAKSTLHLYLPEWADKYGDIMQINLLVKKVVIINNAEVFKRLVKDHDFRDFTNDRPPTFFANFIHGGEKNIAHTQCGPNLQEKRKIFHTILKFYGEGRDPFEKLLIMSLAELTDTMKRNGNLFDLLSSIRDYILTVLNVLLTGEYSEVTKTTLGKLEAYGKSVDVLFPFEVDYPLQTIPLLRYIPGLHFKPICDSATKAKQQMEQEFFYARVKTFNADNKRGLVDELISIQQEMGADGLLDDATSIGIICDLVMAAYLTSFSTLTSLFLFLIKHQDIQDRVYEEIKNVIGDSTPSFKHRQQMPYTEAVILETLRLSSNVPLLLPHCIRNDIVFDGYTIPKSTILFMNAWHNHHRQDFWKDPWTFRPERFLDSYGLLVEPDHPYRQKLIAFGTGRRGCPGEIFGKFRVFLMATFMIQKFQFVPDEHEPLPSIDPRDWKGKSVLCSDHYKCKIIARSDF